MQSIEPEDLVHIADEIDRHSNFDLGSITKHYTARKA